MIYSCAKRFDKLLTPIRILAPESPDAASRRSLTLRVVIHPTTRSWNLENDQGILLCREQKEHLKDVAELL